MRPYLAILRDSFHEGLASRVLWILIILSTLLLAAPGAAGRERAGRCAAAARRHHGRGFAGQEAQEPRAEQAAIAGTANLWARQRGLKDKLPAETPQGEHPAESSALAGELADELDAMLKRVDFYDEDDWKPVHLDKEARELLERGLDKLPPERLERFNRLALEAAFPMRSPAADRRACSSITCPGRRQSAVDRRDDLISAINQTLLLFTGLVLGVGGTLAAILVTASIIPQTFEAGAIDLLLSKPVSRPLVFLTKFVGGCAFIGLIAAWLIGGLWLILGFRFELWERAVAAVHSAVLISVCDLLLGVGPVGRHLEESNRVGRAHGPVLVRLLVGRHNQESAGNARREPPAAGEGRAGRRRRCWPSASRARCSAGRRPAASGTRS